MLIMKSKMTKQIGVRLLESEHDALVEISRATTFEVSALARLGIRRLISEWETTGRLTIAKEQNHERKEEQENENMGNDKTR